MNTTRHLSFCAAALLALSIACSDPSDESLPDTDAGADAGADIDDTDATADLGDMGGDADDADGDVAEDVPVADPCSDDLEWEPGAVLDSPRDHHGTFGYRRGDGSDWLVVTGGTSYDRVFGDAWEAPIGADGSLGEWTTAPALPGARAGHAVVESQGRTWLVAGRERAGFLSGSLRAEFDDDGALVGWAADAELPVARFHASATTDGTTLFFSGGLGDGNEATDTVFASTIQEDGSLGPWREATPMPAARSHHATFVHDGYLYAAYGFEGNPIGNQTREHTNIVRAPIDGDSIGAWEVALFDGLAISTLSVTVVDDCPILVGGLIRRGDDYEYNADVWRLDLDTGTRAPIGRLNQGRSHLHQAPWVGGRLYLVGGSVGLQDVTGTTEIGRFQP